MKIASVGFLILQLAMTAAARSDETYAQPPRNPGHDRMWKGTITAVNPAANTLKVRSIWLSKKFQVARDCQIAVLDRNKGSLSDLVPGEHVEVVYRTVDGVPIGYEIAQIGSSYIGRVKSVDSTNHLLVMQHAPVDMPRAPTRFRVADRCEVSSEGIEVNPGRVEAFRDIQPGDRISVTYDFPHDRPVAYRIGQKSSTFVGKMDWLDARDRTVTASNRGQRKKFVVASDCKVILNGSQHGRIKDLQPGFMYRFNYDDVMGVNVLERVTRAKPLTGVPPLNAGLSVVNNPR